MRAPRLIGPGGRFYADPTPSPDETAFRQDNNSAAYYNSPYYRLHKNQVQPIPPPRPNAPLQLDLTAFLPPAVAAAIDTAGQITFHAVGDTGAAKVTRAQTATIALAHQAAAADAMAKDVAAGGASAPAFFFHLGDLIYNFGEGQYYYDQFYEPYREYDRPIFAVPGNHDGMVFGPTSTAPQVPSLAAFLTNFCAAEPGPSPDAGGLVRSVMTQPGVYFTLDAPFVSIIGLYSNVLDGPGVLSSQGGHFPLVNDQLAFLQSELRRLQPDRLAGHRAVVLAVHHPPLSADVKHGGSTGLQADLDTACQAAGLWPDAVLSGHAHLCQRFTRVVAKGQQTPYVVSGSGGFAVTPPGRHAAPGAGHHRRPHPGDRPHPRLWLSDCHRRHRSRPPHSPHAYPPVSRRRDHGGDGAGCRHGGSAQREAHRRHDRDRWETWWTARQESAFPVIPEYSKPPIFGKERSRNSTLLLGPHSRPPSLHQTARGTPLCSSPSARHRFAEHRDESRGWESPAVYGFSSREAKPKLRWLSFDSVQFCLDPSTMIFGDERFHLIAYDGSKAHALRLPGAEGSEILKANTHRKRCDRPPRGAQGREGPVPRLPRAQALEASAASSRGPAGTNPPSEKGMSHAA